MAHTCPWWLGYLLLSPIRKLFHSPRKILAPYLQEGMKALDVGPGMGFFSIPMAEWVGAGGLVIACDLQPQMLAGLARRAARRGLADRFLLRQATPDSLQIADLKGQVDFGLLFAVVHEVASEADLWSQVHEALKESGLLLVSEPANHVSQARFNRSIEAACRAGFTVEAPVRIRRSHSVLLRKRQKSSFALDY